MKIADATKLAREKITQHGLTGVRFSINKRLKNTLGRYMEIHGGFNRAIELSYDFVVNNDEAAVLDTILHEIAHAIAGVKADHGPAWKAVCRQIGCRPEQYASNKHVTIKYKWQLAYIRKGEYTTHVERFNVYRHNRTDVSNRMMTGRRETLGNLHWLEANN
jgi:predicted SprT family Zn-dependent metalloprotease